MAEKVGVTNGSIVILIVALVAHCPVLGVNVYVVAPVIDVLIAEFHVPLIGGVFVEFAGKIGATEFWHKGLMVVKMGITKASIVISIVVDVAHCPVFGVKV